MYTKFKPQTNRTQQYNITWQEQLCVLLIAQMDLLGDFILHYNQNMQVVKDK